MFSAGVSRDADRYSLGARSFSFRCGLSAAGAYRAEKDSGRCVAGCAIPGLAMRVPEVSCAYKEWLVHRGKHIVDGGLEALQ